jgi:phosphoribosylformylglycinamidine synthase subunit PurQ / glutaminase
MAATPRILILSATGSNRDRDVAWACELAGGAAEIVHINALVAGDRKLADFQMLVLPGGFSYGDDLGAGKLWAVTLRHRLGEALDIFVAAGKPVLGICNGFQALVKAGFLPGDSGGASKPSATLTRNERAHFECRWVHLAPNPASPCVFTKGLEEPIFCPVAHGEGQFVTRDAATLAAIEARGGVALRYVDASGTRGGYPHNPNGSAGNIAGITNAGGTVLGLMPHPENHIHREQHPEFHRGVVGQSGLALFKNGIRYAAGV